MSISTVSRPTTGRISTSADASADDSAVTGVTSLDRPVLAGLDPATSTLMSRHTGEELWTPGGPTEYGVEVFTSGDCWALAWYVARMTAGRLVTLGWPDWHHVAVRLDHHDRSLYLDATGLHTRTELMQAWGKKVVPMNMNFVETFDDYEEVLDAGFVYDVTHGEVSDFAHLLTAMYLPNITALRLTPA